MTKEQRALPSRPNMDLLRKRAKGLLAAARRGDEKALRRIATQVGNSEHLSLSQVQLAMAREYDLPSWRALVAHVDATRSIAGALLKCIREGDVSTLLRLLDSQPKLVNLPLTLDEADWRTHPQDARPLHLAVGAGQLDSVRLLISKGAQLDALNGGGRSALHDSLEHGRREITQALLAAGASIDVFSAAQLGDGERLRNLLQQNPNAVHDMSTELPLLAWLSYAGHVELLPILVEFGAQLSAASALRPAASCNHWRFVEASLDLGLNPNEPVDALGRTSLHFAAAMPFSADSSETVRLLLSRGADARAVDVKGLTPLDVAREKASDPKWRNYEPVIGILEAAMLQSDWSGHSAVITKST